MDLNLKKIPGPIYLRYLLLNIPGLAAVILILILIQNWVAVAEWLFWSIIGFWVVLDLVLFPFTWRAYDWDRAGQSRSMVGEHGIAKERLAPSGYVQVHGELWRAELIDDGLPAEKGQIVKIVKMDGLTLYVEPLKKGESNQDGF